jgi:SAM-dependent methyltransferase
MPEPADTRGRRWTAFLRRIAHSRPVAPLAEILRSLRTGARPRVPLGWVRFGSLRRLDPISRNWGFDRGGPVDRWYIERFLEANRADVRGRVLEVGADRYASRFGGDRVTSLDILDVDAGNEQATIHADLGQPDTLPHGRFDCIIVTQTLHLVFDVRQAFGGVVQMLAPGGVALVTVPGITAIEPPASGAQWHWSMTALSVRRMLGSCVGVGEVAVEVHGNVLAAAAFLYGVGARELTQPELEHLDPAYPVVVTARVVRAASIAAP